MPIETYMHTFETSRIRTLSYHLGCGWFSLESFSCSKYIAFVIYDPQCLSFFELFFSLLGNHPLYFTSLKQLAFIFPFSKVQNNLLALDLPFHCNQLLCTRNEKDSRICILKFSQEHSQKLIGHFTLIWYI